MNIRMRFFLNVAIILLIGVFFSYFIPKYLVNKDIDKAGLQIRELIETREKNTFQVINLLVEQKLSSIEHTFSKKELWKDEHAILLLGNVLKNLAIKISADVILVIGNELSMGFTKEGKYFQPEKSFWQQMDKPHGEILKDGQKAYYQQFEVESAINSHLYILTEKSYSVLPILDQMRSSILNKISFTLLWAAIFGLAIALFLLAKLSKKMTKPIIQMAHAAEEIGGGNYERIILPNVGKRDDEVAILVKNFDKMRLGLQEREKIRGVLNKVVSKEIASEILKNPVELGGEERIVTVLFSDIRGFTKMTETMDPQNVISMMNRYLTEMCHIIDKNGGVVDKFVGDEIMALYGAPISIDAPAIRAIKTALEMQRKLHESNKLRKEPIEMGIGIHTGLVVAGNQGTENRLNYTVLGANVNLAARLCASARPGEILITEALLNEPNVRDQFNFQSLGLHQFKGFDHPIPIYNILS